jgi:hypothetical protein
LSFEVINLIFVCVGLFNLLDVLLFDFAVEILGQRLLVILSLCIQISGYFCLVSTFVTDTLQKIPCVSLFCFFKCSPFQRHLQSVFVLIIFDLDWAGEQLPFVRFLVGYGLVVFGFPIGRLAALGLYQTILQHVADVCP